MFLGQHKVYLRGLCESRIEILLLQRGRRKVRALPYHRLMGSSNSAWQPTQPLHHPVQGVLVDEVGGWSLDAGVHGAGEANGPGLHPPAQVEPRLSLHRPDIRVDHRQPGRSHGVM